jgi:hypothetical protein
MWLVKLGRSEPWGYYKLADIAAIDLYFSKGIVSRGRKYRELIIMVIYALHNWFQSKSRLEPKRSKAELHA